MSAQLEIAVPRYSGPFDLLLALVRKHAYPLDELPIPTITAQFLEYVRTAQAFDVEMGGDYIEVASWLVLLKSRSLLPSLESEARAELQEALLDRATLNRVTGFLKERMVDAPGHSRGAVAPGPEPADDGPAQPVLGDVLASAQHALAAARAAQALRQAEDPHTVEDLLLWVREELAAQPAGQPLSTAAWFAAQPTGGARAALLLALLEMARKGEVLLNQKRISGSIYIKRSNLLR